MLSYTRTQDVSTYYSKPTSPSPSLFKQYTTFQHSTYSYIFHHDRYDHKWSTPAYITNWKEYVATPWKPTQPSDQHCSFGAGLPPVPSKLVTRIEAGEFIDMGELLPDCVGISRPKGTGKALIKHHTMSGILEWVKCSMFTWQWFPENNLGESPTC